MPNGKTNPKLPADVLEKLGQLDADLEEEEITIKGYCKRKWALLQEYASKNVARDVEKIQTSLAKKSIDEKEAYSKMLDLLRTEREVLVSTENLAKEKDVDDLVEASCSNDALQTTILKNYFHKVVVKNSTPIHSNKSNIKKRKLPEPVGKTKDKRRKTNDKPSPSTTVKVALPNVKQSKKCDICNQSLNDVLIYKGHPLGAVYESVALTNSKLLLFTGDENEIHTSDQLPHNKITQFNVYDAHGHLCPFDSGLLEKNILLYFSGYLKPIYDEKPSARGGVAVKDMGPINEWFTSGFDGGQNALLGFSTAYGVYYLMKPSKEYQPIMKPVWEKIYLSKLVIEFLLKTAWENPTYEDLLIYLNNCEVPTNISQPTEENLLKHAQFICEQVSNFDSAVEEDDLFIATSCMMSLVNLAGVTFAERKEIRKEDEKEVKIKNKSRRTKNLSKATTTELVREVFDSFFPEQLDKNSQLNCGKCKNCKKTETGEKGLMCTNRRCPTPNESDTDESSDAYHSPTCSKSILHSVTWLSDPLTVQNGRTYYSSAKVGSEFIKLEDHVLLQPDKPNLPLLIVKIVTMWDHNGGQFFHANLFFRGIHTVLGEISDQREIFQVDECEDCPLGSIVRKAEVEYKILPPDLNSSLGNDSLFFCQKRYDRNRGRFENLFEDKLNYNLCNMILGFKPCWSCKRQADKKKIETAVVEEGVVKWRGEIYKPGVGVYLLPGTFGFKNPPVMAPIGIQTDPVDENMYPEFYRKKTDNIIGIEISEPFCIGYIKEILADDLNIKVQKLYRPENTHSTGLGQQLDINILYWSEEQITVPFSKVTGQCYIVFGGILDIPISKWSSQGPNRFYFLQSYNSTTQEFLPVSSSAKFVGRFRKNSVKPEKWATLKEPLKTMDVFAGCGGLSEGLHQSGVADTKWAIEKDETAALAYSKNNSQTIVFSEDCNDLLSEILSGVPTKNNQPLPRRGDVELLVGGPPCQGFSGMNRFNAGQYSLFKNSLIVSYLSYCDYYRPKFFILENVRNFVTFKKSMVLKLTLRCLLAMGYQCAFGVLQAGNYGVPQIRRRFV